MAEITSEALKGIPFDVIFSSPLKRAYQTAEIMKRERQIPLIVDELLKEISFGCFEGLCCTGQNYNIPDPDFPNFFQNPAHYNPPEGGESIAELCVRGTDFLTWLIDRPEYQDKNCADIRPWSACESTVVQSSDYRFERFLEGRRP